MFCQEFSQSHFISLIEVFSRTHEVTRPNNPLRDNLYDRRWGCRIWWECGWLHVNQKVYWDGHRKLTAAMGDLTPEPSKLDPRQLCTDWLQWKPTPTAYLGVLIAEMYRNCSHLEEASTVGFVPRTQEVEDTTGQEEGYLPEAAKGLACPTTHARLTNVCRFQEFRWRKPPIWSVAPRTLQVGLGIIVALCLRSSSQQFQAHPVIQRSAGELAGKWEGWNALREKNIHLVESFHHFSLHETPNRPIVLSSGKALSSWARLWKAYDAYSRVRGAWKMGWLKRIKCFMPGEFSARPGSRSMAMGTNQLLQSINAYCLGWGLTTMLYTFCLFQANA